MGPNSTAGDVFTALEISKELINLEYEVKFITIDEKLNDPDFDIIINLLHNYDISNLNLKENIIKIAWMRNWFEEWVNKLEIYDYDIYIASSKKSCNYVSKILNKKSFFYCLLLLILIDSIIYPLLMNIYVIIVLQGAIGMFKEK